MTTKTLWPVIHIENISQVLDNVLMCHALDIGQVFLIHMQGDDALTDQSARAVRQQFPTMTIGVNYR